MANLFQPSLQRAIDENGNPVLGARMYFYLSGTLAPAKWYTDQEGLVAGTNPLVADSAGLWAPVYLDPDITYRVRRTKPDGVTPIGPEADPLRGYDESAIVEAADQALAAQQATASNKEAAAIFEANAKISETNAAASAQTAEFAAGVASDLGNAPLYSAVADFPAADGTKGLAIIPFGAEEGIYEDTGMWVRQSDTQSLRAKQFADEAQGYAAELLSPWDETSIAVPDVLNDRVAKIYLSSAKDRFYDIRLYQFEASRIRVIVRDEETLDEVGEFLLDSPDYGSQIPRIPLLNQDTLAGTPAGDPDGANATPLFGYMELKPGISAVAGVFQPGVGEARINRRNVKLRTFASAASPLDTMLYKFARVIEAGPSRDFPLPRAVLDTLLDIPQPTNNASATYIATTNQATPDEQIAILLDPKGAPGEPWLENDLFFPSNVSLIGRYPDAVFFESAPGARRPILQFIGNHTLVDINVKNTVADVPPSSTSSAVYGIHFEQTHNRLYQYPQTPGDNTQDFRFTMLRGSLTKGLAATIQPFGAACPVNTLIEFIDVDGDIEGSSTLPIWSVNTSSEIKGGGRVSWRGCRDKSGRVFNATTGQNATVALQTKNLMPYPNEAIFGSNRHFRGIALSGVAAGMWRLRGDYSGEIYSEIPGDDMGYV